MTHISRKPNKWGHCFCILFLLCSLFACLTPFSAIAADIGALSMGDLSGLAPTTSRQIQDVLENLSPTQRQEALTQLPLAIRTGKTGEPSTKKAPTPRKPPNPSDLRANTKTSDFTGGTTSSPAQVIHGLFPPELTMFGHDLFVQTPNSFVPETNIPIPEDYRLGPGDTVLVQLSGKSFQEHTMTIDREGMLTFPGIGPLPVAGMKFQALKAMLQARTQKQLMGTKIERITLGALRSLQVFVLGDVPHPGSYTVNSLTTVTNAIFSSGGIKPIGSLRDIVVKRQGKTIVTLDLYKLLLHGDQSADIRLQSGDVIFVPPLGTVVAVSGRVKRPGIYETRPETTLQDALELAGGLLPDADPTHVKMDRFQSQKKRILLDLNITRYRHLHFRIQSGDQINIPAIPKPKSNVVTLSGAVINPGEYQWYKGLHLANVVLSKKLLLPQADLSYAVITRLDVRTRRLVPLTLNLGRAMEDPSSPDNIALQPWDAIQVFGLKENRVDSMQTLVSHLRGQARFGHQGQVVTLQGHVRFPGSYPFSSGMGLKDLLHAAGDIKVGADMEYALIARSNAQGELQPFSVRLSQLLGTHATEEAIPLQPRDHVLVFQATTPEKTQADTSSAVNATRRMIQNVGDGAFNPMGLADTTDTTSSRRELLAPVLAKLRHQARSNISTQIVLINGTIRNPGEYPLEPHMRVSDLIRAGGYMMEQAYTLDAEMSRFSVIQGESREIGHTRVDLKKIAQGDTASDLLLQPHDVLLIKRIPQWSTVHSVKLEGEIRFPGVYPVKPGETLFQVLERAGGLTPHAYPEGAVFLRESLKKRETKELETLVRRLEMELAGQELESAAKEQENRSTSYLLRNLVQRLRNTTPQGRLAIDLPTLLAQATQGDNSREIILRNQDHLIIPQKISEITVLGEVFYPTSHQYLPENSVENYVNLSGGFSKTADREHIYVVKANGRVTSKTPPAQLFGTAWLSGDNRFPLTPGDTIVVPLKVEHIAPMALWKDITQILYNIAITSATLKSVGAL